jgi:hypothetical protein
MDGNAKDGTINLLELTDTKVTEVDGREGVFIPFRENGVKKYTFKSGKIAAFLNFFMMPKKDYKGNDYMVSRARTKHERGTNAYTEILGNAREYGQKDWKHPKYTKIKKPSVDEVVNKNEEDSPF